MTATRPVTILIAALGGEGGGVLTQWIVSAAAQAGFPVQSTSIPGVAQRTGATTYYVEILPTKIADLNGKRPVLALTPGVGDIDIAVASELLESGRTVANGFVTPSRTHVISSLSRFYAMDEKIAMGDGRFDQDRLIKIINEHAKDALLVDMDALAKQSGSIINAVMLGAIAGCGRLPLAREQFEAAIREDGKAVDSNLKGFRAGYDAARAKLRPAKLSVKKSKAAATPAFVEHEVARTFPAVAKAYGALSITRMSPMGGFILIACGPSSRMTRRWEHKASY
jgi:indolepyruvate ferredoxin oxidoreductase beta subunit